MKLLAALAAVLVVACGQPEKPAPPVVSTAPAPPTQTTPPAPELVDAPAPAGVEPVSGPKLTPSDEGPSDDTFAAFRTKLRAAVAKRDVAAVLALSDPNIRTTFGARGGAAELELLLARPGMWESLERLLSLGGAFAGDGAQQTFWAPYVYASWPDERDAFSGLAVIAENVPLRKSAAADSEVVATLSYDLVDRATAGSEGTWMKVKTADGRTGFVEASHVLSPLAYRAGFSRRSGEWKMEALVAGD